MAIRTSELTKLIAEQVTKEVARKLVPKLRKVVREEFDRGVKDMIYEMVMNQKTPLQNVVEENTAKCNCCKTTCSSETSIKKQS